MLVELRVDSWGRPIARGAQRIWRLDDTALSASGAAGTAASEGSSKDCCAS